MQTMSQKYIALAKCERICVILSVDLNSRDSSGSVNCCVDCVDTITVATNQR